MTRRPPGVRLANDAGLLWLACAIALGAGYYLTFALLGTAIERQHQLTAQIWRLRLAQSRTLAIRPELEREERAIDERLRILDLRADKPTLAARFIRAATRVAGAHHVNLDGVDERATAFLPDPAAHPPGGPFAFEPIPLDVSLSGSYGALLATMSELARAPVAMQIDIAALERDAPRAGVAPGDVTLSARLHIVLQRLADDAPVAAAAPPIQ